jgi:dihydropyrimidine dehydrogenase (NAD+) subunit PreA
MVERESLGKIVSTPVAKVDHVKFDGAANGAYATPLHRIPRVDEIECVGCNLCALVCPVDGCITMERVDNGLPFESWEQRVSAGAGVGQ